MKCRLCGAAEAKVRLVTESYDTPDGLLVIGDIPMIHCDACCEDYFEAATLRQLDHIRRNPELAEKQTVRLFRMAS